MSEQKNDNKVGYRRPPAHSRFRPGQTGNPKGRPKGAANLRTDLRDELSEHIRVREGERDLKVSKQRAMLKALVAKALRGDARAANVVLGLVSKLFEAAAPVEPVPNLTADDQAILERFLARRISGETPKP
jgi:hypothetical protein